MNIECGRSVFGSVPAARSVLPRLAALSIRILLAAYELRVAFRIFVP
jgi:hypothetical protein